MAQSLLGQMKEFLTKKGWLSTRPLFVTIDGDGFIYRSGFDHRSVGELIYDEILCVYPYCFTASFIAGEMEKYPAEFDVDLVREILALENVEAASHSWSHPHDWVSEDVDIEQETTHSVRYIEQRLLPQGKKVKLFLWTGKCNPTEQALAAVDRLGIGNLNGCNPFVPWVWVGKSLQFSARAYDDWHYMDLGRLIRETGGSSVYSFLKGYHGRLDGFSRIITFYHDHPDLPVHVYFHWYSAVRRESLDALKKVLDWCSDQGCRPVFASDYVTDLRASITRVSR